jgi:GDPmannose 4,6-dehydratase
MSMQNVIGVMLEIILVSKLKNHFKKNKIQIFNFQLFNNIYLLEGMWLMLQQDQPDDFVLATGETHTVREYCEKAFAVVGKTIVWEGEGEGIIGKEQETGKIRIRVDPIYFRPTEVDLLLGDPTKAHKLLGWKRKVDFDSLVKEMVLADIEGARIDSKN